MDKALKQRLVGAIVLIILAVIVLPMLLSGRSETLKQESREIEVPPRPDELSLETRRFPVDVPNRPEPVEQQAREAGVEATHPEAADMGAVETVEEAIATTDASAQSAAPEAAVAESPVVTKITVPATVEAPEREEPAAVESPDAPRYLVQVASFSNEKRANTLAQTLREQGLTVVMDVVERTAGRMHRVRVGPYVRRAEADAVVANLREEIDGLAPRVLDLRPDESAPVTTPSDPLVRWVVQVGSFSEQPRADALVAQLREAGLPAFSERVTSRAGAAYKVRLGPEISRERAVELMDRVKRDHGLTDSFVTTSE
jgi:cell division septation protein DedD